MAQKNISEILSPITTRVVFLEGGNDPQIVDYAELDVAKVYSNGLTGVDPDSLIQHLDYLLEECKDLKSRFEVIYTTNRFTDDTKKGETFVDVIVEKTAATKRGEAISAAEQEIDIYIKFLEKAIKDAEQLLIQTGSNRFANAGFRLNLDFTQSELYVLINKLIDTGIILHNNDARSRSKVYDFFIKNFNSQDGSPLSKRMLEKASTKRVLKDSKEMAAKIQKLLDAIKSY